MELDDDRDEESETKDEKDEKEARSMDEKSPCALFYIPAHAHSFVRNSMREYGILKLAIPPPRYPVRGV